MHAPRLSSAKNKLAEGDVVLVDLSNKLVKKQRLGRVESIKPDSQTVICHFRIADSSPMESHEVSIRKLLMI